MAKAKAVLVRGIGDVGSTVAYLLQREGYRVVLHDIPLPTWPRRKMALTDAIFDGEASLAGVTATRIDQLATLGSRVGSANILVSVHDFQQLLQALQPDVLVDARMRKRQTPECQIHLARCTVGLGPNFIASETTHLVIETAYGDTLGAVITSGSASPQAGAPKILAGYGIERVVYAAEPGIFNSDLAIGDTVAAGQVVAHVGPRPLTAPLGGRLRGLTRSGVPVTTGTKVIEVDPRGDGAVVTGIGDRPAKIAEGVLRAIRSSEPSP
jgi:xanthine dehydrogenase accessory factor